LSMELRLCAVRTYSSIRVNGLLKQGSDMLKF
jgi:hypothetical protein